MVSIGEIATALTGYPFDSKLFNETKGFPLIRIRNLKEGRTDTFFDGDFDKTFLIRKGDLLIGMDGEFNLVEWQSVDALLNQRVMKVIPNEKLVSKNYLKYALPKRLKEIEDATPFVTVKHLSHKKVLDSKIPLPDLKTQQKIAGILAQADAARQKRKQANQLTEQFIQSAFLEMFGDPVRNERDFSYLKLEEVSENIFLGLTSKVNYVDQGGFPLIRATDINEGKLSFDKVKFISESQHHQITKNRITKKGDVLVSKSGSLGTCAIVDTDLEFTTYESIITIQLNPKLMVNHFLIHLIRNSSFQNKIVGGKVGGTVYHLNLEMFRNILAPVPPLPLQQKFAALVEQVERLRTKQRESERELENLFQSLMQKYFG